jgi:hypothetical protein
MRFRQLKNWDDPASSVGLAYFSQLLEEMLFVFSLDTYKASVMHTGLLCAEALEVIKEIELGNIKHPNIMHVNEELCSTFEKDPVAQALVPLPSSAFFPTLKNPKSTLKEMETVLSFLCVQLTKEKYRLMAQTLLKQEITGTQSVTAIRRLTRSYVTSLISAGYDQRYVQIQASAYFYPAKNRIADASAIEGFFGLFPFENSKFNVIFKVDPIFEHLGEDLAPLRLKITKSIPEGIDVTRHEKFMPDPEHALFAVATDVSTKDPYSARDLAEYRLKLCSTLLNLFHHKENPSWRSECLVYDVSRNAIKQISIPINAMHKCADLKPEVASLRMQMLLREFSLENNSFAKFVRSAQLHSMALTSNSHENQILNLWIALESLIPSETKQDDASNIEHIAKSLAPFLNIGYIEKLIYNLAKDLLRWNSRAVKKALRGINGKKFSEKLIKLMIFEEYKPQRDALTASFRDFHLMTDRFDFLSTVVSKPANTIEALDAHQIRLAWQIRRIYRTRNIIVHSGKTPSYTKALIEHTHDYLDTVLLLLVKLASNPKSINSVAQGFKYVEMKYVDFYKSLSTKNLVFTEENIESLLLMK